VLYKNCRFGPFSLLNEGDQVFRFEGSQFTDNTLFRMVGESDVNFIDCYFDGDSADDVLLFYDGTVLNSLTLHQCSFDRPVVFNHTSIKESFRSEGSTFNSYFDLHNVNLPENNTTLRWPSLNDGKLKVFLNDTIFSSTDTYSREMEPSYYALLKSYAQLQRIYKNNGDRASYNASYVEMRNMETNRYHHDFKESPGLNTFFEWRLNVFLKRFCNYGTSPVKALLYSFLVIEIFALLYFFFPSTKTRIRVRSLFRERSRRNIDSRTFRATLKELGIQIVDAMATSMNAFVTLGYGSMPVKGVGKYLAVLEGLIGWFLLSIFSVSLISQILQ